MVRGLEHEFMFDQEYIEDVALRLKEYKLRLWNVTQRIRRMNKKLDRLLGQKAAEKVGKGWALTTFLREAWGLTKEEMLTNMTQST